MLNIVRLARVAKDNTALPRTKKPDVSARLLFRKNNRQDLDDQPTLVPHSLQNFAPGGNSFWQFEHFAGTCDAPQSLQNFAPACSEAPHLTHF